MAHQHSPQFLKLVEDADAHPETTVEDVKATR